jgi:hypothetical protein
MLSSFLTFNNALSVTRGKVKCQFNIVKKKTCTENFGSKVNMWKSMTVLSVFKHLGQKKGRGINLQAALVSLHW